MHKEHWKQLAKAQGSTLQSHHPFPIGGGQHGDKMEALVSIIQQLLVKMRMEMLGAFGFLCFSLQFNHLEEVMAQNRR